MSMFQRAKQPIRSVVKGIRSTNVGSGSLVDKPSLVSLHTTLGSLFKMQFLARFILLVAAVAAIVSAHPGGHAPSTTKLEANKLYKRSAHQRYTRCASSSAVRRRHAHDAQVRRQEHIDQLRARTLRRRNLSDYASEILNTTHHSNRTDLTNTTIASTGNVFNSNHTEACVLQPEVTIGPYWVSGELVRSNVTDDEPGVPLYLDAQFVDIDTCEPVKDLYWEIWSCNSTGVYSGVQAPGNGNQDDDSNLNATFLRGVQQTDENGASQFQTIFPGHYTGRTTHIHVVAHTNATLLANNTLASSATGGAIHIGQLFFDQDLISQVEAIEPYASNTQNVTTNADDFIFVEEAANQGSDPIVEYVWLGSSVQDGIFAWATIAVDVGANYTTQAAVSYTDHGGVTNQGSQTPGMGMGRAPPS